MARWEGGMGLRMHSAAGCRGEGAPPHGSATHPPTSEILRGAGAAPWPFGCAGSVATGAGAPASAARPNKQKSGKGRVLT